jgi:hypothetical protein
MEGSVMSWWKVWRKGRTAQPEPGEVSMPEGARTAPRDGRMPRPAQAQAHPRTAAEGHHRRIQELLRRRDALLFDVEQGEIAIRDDNPWSERIQLLDSSLETIEQDRAVIEAMHREPGCEVPPVPIEHIAVTSDEPASVRFSIDGEVFHFAEEIDWDQRGGAVVRGDLQPRQGDVTHVLPNETPADQREALALHLGASLLTFATDLRDRALEQQALPQQPTLRDLASPCPRCGGWQDWGGRCSACVERDMRKRSLHAEALRIQDERAAEEETRHRLAERLPLARRRLADVEAELTALRTSASEH